jgi:drug/metabolite transporter (DMT)-like permease
MVNIWVVHGTLCLSQLILVVHSFVVKHSLESTTNPTSHSLHPPLVFAALRSAISAPILLLLYFSQSSAAMLSSGSSRTTTTTTATSTNTRRDYLHAAACGFFGVFLYPILYALGLRLTTPTAACVCEALTPIFSLAFEWAASYQSAGSTSQRASSSTRTTCAVMFAVSGSILMTVHGAWVDSSGDVTQATEKISGRVAGNLLVVASAAMYALFLSVQRRTMRENGTSVMFLTAWGNIFGSMLLISTATFMGALDWKGLVSDYLPSFWYGLIFAALVTSVLGYTLEGLANSWSSPTLVALYNAVQPFGAGVMSHGVAGGKHAASIVELGAAALVCSGVLMLKSKSEKPSSRKKKIMQVGIFGGGGDRTHLV